MATLREVQAAYEAGIRDGLKDVGDACLEKASAIIADEAVDRGDLLSSGEVLEPEARSVTVKWSSAHAKYVNWPTRPHWPPLAPILAWVKRNIRRYTSTSGEAVDVIKPSGRQKERARKTPDKVAEEVARAVQAKIAKEGTHGVFFAQRGAQHARPLMAGLLRDGIEARLRRLK